jgi:linearmycin/streptolysin S transport system permease protein
MRKLLVIAQKELYLVYTDRNLLLILLAAPLAIATIIGLAFGGQGSGDIPIKDIPVAIVNLDSGSGGQNYGQIFVSAFVENPSSTGEATSRPACPTAADTDGSASNQNILFDLTNAVKLDDVEAARKGVDDGTYTAAIIIPKDFSQKIGYGLNDPVEPSQVEVYANGGRAVPAGIIRSIVESIGAQIATGSVAVASTLNTISDDFGLAKMGQIASSPEFGQNVACAFTPSFNNLKIEQKTVAGESSTSVAAILVLFGSAQAMFFSLFTGQQGVLSIYEERRQWTLQRLVVSPTPRLYILLGKLAGTFANCVVQLTALAVALTVVGSIMSGKLVLIWGNNLLLVGVVILCAAAAVTGLGTLLAGIARTPEQGGTIGQLINFGLAMLGGAFGFQLPEGLARFSMIYWGTNAFQKLAANQVDIGPNLLVLLAHAVILFGIGFWLFNRRLDI